MSGGFGPDLVWTKSRNNAYNHALFDTVRGATKRLRSNTNNGEDTQANQVKSFTSDGFVHGSDVPNTSGESGVYGLDAGTSNANYCWQPESLFTTQVGHGAMALPTQAVTSTNQQLMLLTETVLTY